MSDEVVDARQGERAEAMRHLPGTYSLALRLRDAGLDNELIAECLAVEQVALDLLLQVAEAKLTAILEAMHDEGASSPSRRRLSIKGEAVVPAQDAQDEGKGTYS
jgi:hypothetical protein